MNAIEVKDLNFSYSENEVVISHLSFEVKKGSYISIVGHNGSGKSTLAKLIIGLLKPNSGDIFIDGEKLTNKNLNELRQKIALVFQNPDNQFIGATVEDDIAFGLENRSVPRADMKRLVQEFADKVGMGDYLNKEPSNLSGGQKQRVAIAGALALNSQVLILDEATSMLDPKGKKEINNLIREMKKNNPDLTILAITHDVEEAYLSDEVIVLSHGELALRGNAKEVFSDMETIKKYNLDQPFVVEMTNKLKEMGINCPKDSSIDDIAELLWPSK